MRTEVAASWKMLRDAMLPRGSLSHEVRGAQPLRSRTFTITRSHSLLLTPKPRSRVAHGKQRPGLSTFLKNNTKSRSVWQETFDFS